MHTKFDVLCLYPQAIYLFPTLENAEIQNTQNKMFQFQEKTILKQKRIEIFFPCR